MSTSRGLALLLALVTVTAPVAGATGGFAGGLGADERAGQLSTDAVATEFQFSNGPDRDDHIRVKLEPRNPIAAVQARLMVNVRHDFGHVVTADVTPKRFERLQAAPGISVSRVAQVQLAHHKSGHSGGPGGGDDDGGDGTSSEVSTTWQQPADGDRLAGTVTLEIGASTTKSKIDRVEWRVDDGPWRSATDGSGTWSATWDTATVADGTHTLTARATNKRGASDTATIAVETDNVNEQPTVSWVTPSDGDTVSGVIDLAVAADDPDGSVDAVAIQIDGSGGAGMNYNDTTGLWELTWDSTSVADGTHELLATVSDDEGATGTAAITVTTDNVNDSPVVDWRAPSDGASFLQGDDVAIWLAADDPDGSIERVTWRVEGGVERTPTYNESAGRYEDRWNTTDYPAGTYNLTATAVDDQGASATATIAVTLESSNDPPTLSWRSPSDGDVLNGTVPIRIDAADADGNVSGVTWHTSLGDARKATYDETEGAWVDTWNTSAGQDGWYTLTATATDDEGASSGASIGVEVDNVDYAPAVNWQTPGEGDVVSGTVTVEIVPEDDGTVESVEWRVGNGTWRTANPTSTVTWTDSWNTTTVTDGAHRLTAVVVDDAGQSGRATVNVTVDNTADDVQVAWLSPRDGDTVRGDQHVELGAEPFGDVESVEWQVDGGEYRPATFDNASGSWVASWDTSGTWTGSHDLSARATTADGSVGTATITVAVGQTPSDATPYGIERLYDDSTIERTSGGDGIDVAVLDTGVDTDHPDLRATVVRCVDAGGFGTCEDGHGHGTHVAGTVLANGGSDGAGIYGVAPDANLHAYKVLADDGMGYADDIAAAIHDAADNGVEVVSLSLGAPSESSLIADAIAARSDEVVVIAAAGNSGPDLDTIGYPAANPEAIAVAAVNETDAVTWFSSRGVDANAFCECERYVEVAAAGAGVESTYPDGGYATLDGTSMATPHVSGYVAKVWASGAADLDGDGFVTPTEVREYVRTQAVDVTEGDYAGAGYDPASGVGVPVLP